MEQRFFRKVFEPIVTGRILLALAIFIATVLAIAAWGKIFYPAEFVKILDQWVSGFEILLLVMIIFLRNRWQLWLSAAVIFAGWCGYALYWYCLQLPCSCMGAMLSIPTAFSISIDIFFFVSSLFAGYLLGAARQWIYFSTLSGLMAALIGFAFAEWVYQNVVVRL